MEEFEIENGVLKKYHEIEGKTSVIVPDNVTKIGYDAFSNCKSLRNIVITENVNEIDNCRLISNVIYAFKNCTSLTNITLPNYIKEINDILFGGCSNLINVKTGEQTFSKLWFDDKYLIVSNFARQYNTNNIYNQDDIKRYMEFIRISKEDILSSINFAIRSIKEYGKKENSEQRIRKIIIDALSPIIQNKHLLYFMCNNMDNAFTVKELDELIKVSVEIEEVEMTAFLMNYKHRHFGEGNYLDSLSLDDDNILDENLGNSK